MPTRKDTLLEDFLDLCRVPSPSAREREAAKTLVKKIREIGYEPLEDDSAPAWNGDCGNIVVKVPGTGRGPRLLLAAHMDTVEKPGDAPAEPAVDGEWIRRAGGGILGADDKTGAAALLQVLRRLAGEGKKHGDLVFVFTMAEEAECLGASELDQEIYLGLDGGVALDYTSPADIIVASPTKVSFRITVHGRAGHAAYPESRINAAFVMAQTMSRLPMGRLDEYTTANLGIMRSGTAINVIPGTAYAEYEIRSHRKDVLDFHVKRVIGTIEGVVRENRVFVKQGGEAEGITIKHSQVDVDVEVGYEGFRLADDSAFVKKVSAAVTAAGFTPRFVTAMGGSDANIFNRRGLECVVIGCGMHGAHSDGERANLTEMRGAVEVLMNMITGGKMSLRKKAGSVRI